MQEADCGCDVPQCCPFDRRAGTGQIIAKAKERPSWIASIVAFLLHLPLLLVAPVFASARTALSIRLSASLPLMIGALAIYEGDT